MLIKTGILMHLFDNSLGPTVRYALAWVLAAQRSKAEKALLSNG